MKLFPTVLVTVLLAGLAWMPVLRAAEFTVINTNNAGAGSLRQAMLDANATPGRDRIVFNIPGAGVKTIRPATSGLPTLTDPVEIDAYTQPDSSPNSAPQADNAVRLIALDGGFTPANGLHVQTHHSVIRGFAMTRFSNAIYLQGSSNLVVGNRIGSDQAPAAYQSPTNNPAGNSVGVLITGPCCGVTEVCCNTIGGSRPDERNVIAGNNGNSIRSEETSGEFRDTRVVGNFLGVDSGGLRSSVYTASSGLSLRGANGFQIGGLGEGEGNVVAAGVYAVNISGQSREFLILGNKFGVGADGVTSLGRPSSGILFNGGSTNQPGQAISQSRVEGNILANLASGVGVTELGPFPDPFVPGVGVTRVTISRNSIYSNGFSGISLGSLALTNDYRDLDTGANNRQNFPEIIDVTFTTETTITAALYSQPWGRYRIEFFANTLPHPSGWGEGETFLFDAEVETDGNGVAEFGFTIPELPILKPYITATATDEEGNTSMFSRPFHARSPDVPLVHRHPQSATVLPYTNLTLVADVTGAAPLTFQWQFNGSDIPGATNLTLNLSNIVWETRGSYTLVASNEFGVVTTDPGVLTVLAAPTFLTHPGNALVSVGTNVTFSAQVAGILPIAYQWWREGVALPGATNNSLTLSNVDWPLRGNYSVVASNAFGVAESATAALAVRVRPIIIQQPIAQSIASGGVAYLSVAISNSATVPLTYIWRSNNITVETVMSMDYLNVFRSPPLASNVSYSVQVTNFFNASGVLSSRVTVAILPDTDGDGLPDGYEDAFGLDRNNPADAGADLDNDGMSNREEFTAGNDPNDPVNALRLLRVIAEAGGAAAVEFHARSNRTYRIESRDSLGSGAWQPAATIIARETNRVERWIDPSPAPSTYYRLRTPAVSGP